MAKLTDKAIKALAPREKNDKVTDGAGLYLVVTPAGAKLWRMDYQLNGKRGTEALDVYAKAGGGRGAMSLILARAERDRCRALLAAGVRPADDKAAAAGDVAARAAAARAAARADREARKAASEARKIQRTADHWTVERVADPWALDHGAAWTVKHRHQTHQSLRDHVFPLIGRRPVASITPADILAVLDPLLSAGKAETSRRVSQRLAGIWQYAVLRGHAAADVVTPTGREVTKRRKAALAANPRRNFASIDPAEATALMGLIRSYTGSPVTRAALLVLAFTFVRIGELRFARWAEFHLDGEAPTWVIPAARMKIKLRGEPTADDHVVPLSRQAVGALRELRGLGLDADIVFPHSRKPGKYMSENTVLYALWELGYRGRMTGHGFRALASTMLNEAGIDSALIEAQLAHEKSDRVEAAYNRAQHLERRRLMMQSFAEMLDIKPTGNLVQLRTVAG